MRIQKRREAVSLIKLRRKLQEDRQMYLAVLQTKVEAENYNQWKRDVDAAIAKINTKIRTENYL